MLSITHNKSLHIIVKRGGETRYRAINEWLQLAKRFPILEVFLFSEATLRKCFMRAYRDSRSSLNEIVGR